MYLCAPEKHKGLNNHGKENERSTDSGYPRMHRAQKQQLTGHIKVYYHEKQKEPPGKAGVEEIQPNHAKNDSSQRN